MNSWPIWCSRCTNHTPADWYVDAPGNHEVVCDRHRAASMRWAGAGARASRIDHNPATTAARVGQQSLFDLNQEGAA